VRAADYDHHDLDERHTRLDDVDDTIVPALCTAFDRRSRTSG
jgi:hypothetical protein